MANTAHPTKSSRILSDGYLVSKADENPKVRRFLDAYFKLEECDRLAVDAKLTQIKDSLPNVGVLGAVELLMYVYDYMAVYQRPRKEQKFLRRAHALEQAGWPAKGETGWVTE